MSFNMGFHYPIFMLKKLFTRFHSNIIGLGGGGHHPQKAMLEVGISYVLSTLKSQTWETPDTTTYSHHSALWHNFHPPQTEYYPDVGYQPQVREHPQYHWISQ